ncbi:hypothetical protein F4779DRAFT_400933 [Xylariaceae sp. FL0662B]|nr:hypothetical protein F4779DRAFT_400933 [Xylariaceae sp. FL0662B]
MSVYESYDAPPREHSRRYHHHHHDRHDRLDPRYADTEDTYYRINPSSRTALVPRTREDSDLSVEEVRRDFPPPGYSRDIRRARSADPGYDDYYYESRRSYDIAPRDRRPHRKPGSVYYEEEERTRKRVLNKQEKIIAAVAGGLLAAGAKEIWDRREAEKEGAEVHRNIAASAALGAAGALAGYQGADYYNKHANKEDKKSSYVVHKGRDGRITESYYSDDDDDLKSHKGNKNFLENALSAAGLGSAIKALTGGESERDKDRDDRRSAGTRSRRGSSPDSYRSRESRDTPANRIQKAAKASLVAGAAEAFRVAKEPGGWQGEKMKRVLTAAIGAGTIDAAHDPTKDSKRHLLESVIGGLVGNRVLHGSRKDIEEDRQTGRSRSRSRARSEKGSGAANLAALATAGLGALGAKKLVENRSRSRSRSRRDSYDSYDSRDPSPRKQRSRSRSIVDKARRGLAKLGIDNGSDDRRDEDYYDDKRSRGSRRRSRSLDDDDYESHGYMRGGRGPPSEDDYYDDEKDRSRDERPHSRSSSRGRSSSVSSSDLGDSDDDKKRTGKLRRKQLITTGLAAVATIHAAHNVYGSMGQRNARHKAVKEGRLSPEEARKLKTKALLQDAASVGIAALGVKGAISELKEAREQAKEVTQWKLERQRRHEKRIERLKRANDGHYGRSRADNWSSYSAPQQEARYDDGPRYTDGNPYSASLPAPPVGYDRR